MPGLFRTSPTPSDNIRYGMTRTEHEDMGEPTLQAGLTDFIGGLSDAEREFFTKHGHLAGFKEE